MARMRMAISYQLSAISCQLSVISCLVGALASGCAAAAPRNDVSTLVDGYLDQFSQRHPSIAAGNGLHAHDGTLEDFSAAAIATEVAWLRDFRGKLGTRDPAGLSPDEAVDLRILSGIVDGWLLDLDGVKTW